METLIQHLRNLGFTELEAKCLHVLSEFGTSTGYEIAKRLGVSRSNVYTALQKLVEKGVLLESRGEPNHYHSLSIEDISGKIAAEIEHSIRYVKQNMPKPDSDRSEYFSLDGDAKALERVRTEIRKARDEVLCDFWPEELELLAGDLRAVSEAGARVCVAAARAAEAPDGVQVFSHGRGEGWQEGSGRKFSLVIDRRLAIIGTRGGQTAGKAMLTEHRAMVELLHSHFCQDVVLQELMKDMGAKLEDKYGKNFKKIIQKYTDTKRRKKK